MIKLVKWKQITESNTLLELIDTPGSYEDGKFLKSTTSGTEWSTVSGSGGTSHHSELYELDYESSGHTGFAQSNHTHTESDITDLDKYTQAEVNALLATVSGGVSDHGELIGLSDDDHVQYHNNTRGDARYYTKPEVDTISGSIVAQIPLDYITDVEMTTISGNIVAQIPSLAEYATESYVDNADITLSGALQTQIDGKSDIGHTHDDRYYTESETDNLITTISGNIISQIPTDFYSRAEVDTISGTLQTDIDNKSDLGHTHTESDISDLDKYTQVEVGSLITTTSGDLQTQIDSKSDTSHLHDDRYYTETEVDTLIAAVSGTTDHSILNNLDYESSGHIGFTSSVESLTTSGILQNQINNLDFYTTGEVDTISGSIQTQIDGKSNTGHTHTESDITDLDKYTQAEVDALTWTESDITDLDKYTQAEVDTISGSLSAEIDSDISTHEAGSSHDSRYYTESEVDTISGSLSAEIDSDISTHEAGSSHDDRYYTESETDNLITTVSGNIVSQIPNDFYSRAEVDTISGSLSEEIDSGISTHEAGSSHDGRYYTESEVTTISGNIVSQIPSDFYSQSEVDTISGTLQSQIDGKADTSHNHTESDISDLDKYTQAEVGSLITTTSGDLQTQIDSKSDTSHTHDNRYYTESEVDTISGTLQTEIDNKSDVRTFIDLTDTPTTYSGEEGKYLRVLSEDYTPPAGNNINLTSDENYTPPVGDDIDFIFEPVVTIEFVNPDFYSQSEVNTISGTLSSEIDSDISTHAVSADHDDRYYTENEVDTISGSLSSEIDLDIFTHEASSSHDGRYYTETEVDTISGSLNTKIDTKGDVSADANLGDNKLIRGDGGVKKIQECSTITVSDDGEMTNPSQPCFLAKTTGTLTNVTGDGTTYNLTGEDIFTEVFDQNNDLSDGTFTAPVTGKYTFSFAPMLAELDSAHISSLVSIITSNRTFSTYLNPWAMSYAAGSYSKTSFTIIADMDANDTAYVVCRVVGGTKVVDLYNIYTTFGGALLC